MCAKPSARSGRGQPLLQPGAWALTALSLAVLAACGGGGGGSSSAATETPQDVVTTPATGGATTVVTVDPLQTTRPAFSMNVDDAFDLTQTVADLTGGDLLAGWNLNGAGGALRPGMKVAFFGLAAGCDSKHANGPQSAGSDSELANVVQKAGVSAAQTPTRGRWTPTGLSGVCDSANASRSGSSWVYLNPAASGGGIGMYTPSGPMADGSAPFFDAYGAAGADGAGTNSHILGTFVGFRLPWWSATAVQPWNDSTQVARVVSTQNLASFQVADASVTTSQVKQQIVISVINTACQAARASVTGPCQFQYLFNTATMRGGVSDWESYAPSTQGRIWFDSVQGSTPIISGLIPTAGKTVRDGDSGLALYSSQGGATLHTSFSAQNFDLRISFAQLTNAVKIITAKRLGATPSTVSDDQVATVYGSAWNDASKWVLVAASVGQEVYNGASATERASIGGGFKSLYAGPQ